MRRLYVTTKEAWAGPALDLHGKPITHQVKHKAVPVADADGNWKMGEERLVEVPHLNIELFDIRTGSHYIDLDGTHILMSTNVEHSEYCTEVWHRHPEVARLPHAMWEGNVQIHELLTNQDHAPKQFKQKHLDALLAHKDLKAAHTDTVLTLAKKAQAINPLVKLANVL